MIKKIAKKFITLKNKVLLYKKVKIDRHCCVYGECNFEGGIEIGDGDVIGAGAVVTKNVKPYSVVAGNPVRLLKMRFSDEEIEFLLATEWWNLDNKTLLEFAPLFSDIKLLKNAIKDK